MRTSDKTVRGGYLLIYPWISFLPSICYYFLTRIVLNQVDCSSSSVVPLLVSFTVVTGQDIRFLIFLYNNL